MLVEKIKTLTSSGIVVPSKVTSQIHLSRQTFCGRVKQNRQPHISLLAKCLFAGGLVIFTIPAAKGQDDELPKQTRARTVATSTTFGKMRTSSPSSRTTSHTAHTASVTNEPSNSEIPRVVHGSIFQQVKAFTDTVFGERGEPADPNNDSIHSHDHGSRSPSSSKSQGHSTKSPVVRTATPSASTKKHAPSESQATLAGNRNRTNSEALVPQNRAKRPNELAEILDPPSIPIKSAAERSQSIAARKPTTTQNASPKPPSNVAEGKTESLGNAPSTTVSSQKSTRRTPAESLDTPSLPSTLKKSAIEASLPATSISLSKNAAPSADSQSKIASRSSTAKRDLQSIPLENNPSFDLEIPSIPRKQTPSIAESTSSKSASIPSSALRNSNQVASNDVTSAKTIISKNNAYSAESESSLTRQTNGNSARLEQSASGSDLSMGIPQVKLKLHGPATLKIGESGSYQVAAINEGSEPLSGLLVRVVIPSGVKVHDVVPDAGSIQTERDSTSSDSVIWQLEKIGPYQSKVLNLSLDATRPEHFAIEVEWTVLPQTGQMQIQVQQPQLQMALEGSSEAIFGSPEMYRLRIRNPGNADAKDVQAILSAGPFGSNETMVGDIPAGSERVVEVELTFQQPGKIKIDAVAKCKSSGLTSNTQIDVMVSQAALTMEWQSPAEQFQGTVGSYVLLVTNTSLLPSQNIECVITLPDGAHTVSIPNNAKAKGQEVRWSIPVLAAGGNEKLTMELQLNREGNACMRASLQGSAGARATCESTTRVESISDLKLSVIDPSAPAPIGQPVTYELVIANRGTKPAKLVKVVAQFSNGIEPVNANGQAHRLVPGQVLFEPITAIGPGEQISLKVIAEATEAGMHRFRAEVHCEEGEVQLVHEESTRFLATARTDRANGLLR